MAIYQFEIDDRMRSMRRARYLQLVLALALSAAGLWVTAAAILSGVKVATKQCSATLGAEQFVPGDWFCPAKGGE